MDSDALSDPEAVEAAVTLLLPVRVLEAVSEALALRAADAVIDPVPVTEPLAVTLQLPLAVPVAETEDVGELEGDADAVVELLWLAVTLPLAEPVGVCVPVTVPVTLGVEVMDADALMLEVLVTEPVAVMLLLAVPVADTLPVTDADTLDVLDTLGVGVMEGVAVFVAAQARMNNGAMNWGKLGVHSTRSPHATRQPRLRAAAARPLRHVARPLLIQLHTPQPRPQQAHLSA
jgi:hypothetical protein